MAFRLKASDGSVEASLRRIAAEQLDKALAAIDGEDVDDAVHAVRERCKKLRALIRLVRPVFPGYAAENAFLRDTARMVSHNRDAFVIQETFQVLTGTAAPAPSGSGDPKPEIGPLLEECRLRLLETKARTRTWSLDEQGWDALSEGFAKTIRRARKAAKTARAEGGSKPFHELRKQVKYHGFHCQILRPVRPRKLKRRMKLAARLADDLGRHHDLALLTSHLTGSPTDFISARRSHEVLVAASEDGGKLERRANRRARKLLADRPRSLANKLGKRWKAWAERAGFEE